MRCTPPVLKWQLGFAKLDRSYDAASVIRIGKNRVNKRGRKVFVIEELLVDRSMIAPLHAALREFAANERKAVQDLPL